MRGFMPILHKKSWMVYILHVFDFQVACRRNHSVISNHNHMCGLLNIGPDYFLMTKKRQRLAWKKEMDHVLPGNWKKKIRKGWTLFKIENSFSAKGARGFMWNFFVFTNIFDAEDGNEQ